MCRAFLATLQLANNGNVEIVAGAPGGGGGSSGGGSAAAAARGGGRREGGDSDAAAPPHLAPFRAMFGRGAAAPKAAAAAAKPASVRLITKAAAPPVGDAPDGGDAWLFSQAAEHPLLQDGSGGGGAGAGMALDDGDAADAATVDAAVEAAGAARRGAELLRGSALASGFTDVTLQPGFSGSFRVRLLSTVPRHAWGDDAAAGGGFVAPSAAANLAAGAPPDAGYSGPAEGGKRTTKRAPKGAAAAAAAPPSPAPSPPAKRAR